MYNSNLWELTIQWFAKPDFGCHDPGMAATIAHLRPPVRLTHDRKIAETACRASAARCLREGAIDKAEQWLRAADTIARARTARWPSEG